jgi:hypothetical protein
VTPFVDPAVAAHFASYPPAARRKLLALRELIFRTAAKIDGVGALQETLKWSEPAYVTSETRSGSTVRIDWKEKAPDRYAMYFICRTGLVESFRARFPKHFSFDGNRALTFGLSDELPTKALAACIEASLTYHLRNERRKRRS